MYISRSVKIAGAVVAVGGAVAAVVGFGLADDVVSEVTGSCNGDGRHVEVAVDGIQARNADKQASVLTLVADEFTAASDACGTFRLTVFTNSPSSVVPVWEGDATPAGNTDSTRSDNRDELVDEVITALAASLQEPIVAGTASNPLGALRSGLLSLHDEAGDAPRELVLVTSGIESAEAPLLADLTAENLTTKVDEAGEIDLAGVAVEIVGLGVTGDGADLDPTYVRNLRTFWKTVVGDSAPLNELPAPTASTTD